MTPQDRIIDACDRLVHRAQAIQENVPSVRGGQDFSQRVQRHVFAAREIVTEMQENCSLLEESE